MNSQRHPNKTGTKNNPQEIESYTHATSSTPRESRGTEEPNMSFELTSKIIGMFGKGMEMQSEVFSMIESTLSQLVGVILLFIVEDYF